MEADYRGLVEAPREEGFYIWSNYKDSRVGGYK